MSNLATSLANKMDSLVGKWSTYATFGTFLLYLTGYLTLRFQLSAYGVATNLDAFDEKYLFAGCRFLVYLVSAVPIVLLLALLLAALSCLPYRFFPAATKHRLRQSLAAWAADPIRVPFIGILLAVALIQFVMRNCFVYGSLLLADKLPEHEWINNILLTNPGRRSLFFSGLVAGSLLTAAILFFAIRSQIPGTALSKALVALLAFLLAVEFLLLPVNYGTLIATQTLPRVSALGDEKLTEGSQAWLVWENKEVLTYFVLEPENKRMLLTIPRKDAKVKIVADDRILCVLFGCP